MDGFKFSAWMVVAVFAAGSLACGQTFSIIKVADTSTPIPGGVGDFTGFLMSSGSVFIGEGSGNQEGIYTFGLSTLADTSMAAPGFGAGVDYASFSSVSFGELGTSYVATTTTGAQAVYEQWYYSVPPTTVLIAQTGQSPSAGVTFNSFTSVSSTYQDNEPLNPTGEFLSDAGIYYFSVSSGPEYPPYSSYTISFTQEATTTSPSTFTALGQPNFKAGYPDGGLPADSTIQTMHATANGIEGIYYSPLNGPSSAPAPFAKLVDTTTPVPNGAGDFTSFGDPAADANEIVFTAHYNDNGSDEQGIFSWGPYYFGPPIQTPALQELLASGTVAPGSSGAHFRDFLGITPQGTFLADLDNGTEGIYSLGSIDSTNSTDMIGDVIDTTDMLDGKTIQSFEMSREADVFSSSAVTAFIVNFTDGSQGLYYFSLPEPALAWLVGFPVLLMDRRRR